MEPLDVLLLRFEAPLLSFGGERVDQNGVQQAFPGRAMLTGLLGNSLGFEHHDFAALDALQGRLRYAVRRDRAGEALVDYHTVDLGQPFMLQGWTTRGEPESRGGASSTGTHIRLQHYRADAVFTVALTLRDGEGSTVEDLARALVHPERPLFIGRKCCLPATRILCGRVRADRLRDALRRSERSRRADESTALMTWWPIDEGTEVGRTVYVTDAKDWSNQIHTGRHAMQEAEVLYEGKEAAA